MGEVIFKSILAIVVAAITYYVIPFLKEKKMYNAVKTVVQAAEQIFRESGMGKEKYQYVVDWATGHLNVDEATLKNLIESAVFEINLEKKKE